MLMGIALEACYTSILHHETLKQFTSAGARHTLEKGLPPTMANDTPLAALNRL